MTRSTLIAMTVALLCSAATACAGTAVEAAEALDIVPTPREMTLTGERLQLAGWSICAPEGVTLARTGSDEINDRLAALGGDEIAVRDQPGAGNTILVAPCRHPLARDVVSELGVSPEEPGEQGYVIAPVQRDGRTILAAVGSDDLGTLYACMTLRQMIQPGDGGPELVVARVRDWPMIKRRCLGCIELLDRSPVAIEDREERLAAYAREFEPYIRFLAHNKINVANSRGYWGGRDDPRLDGYRAASEFAARYGIVVRRIHGTAIDGYVTDDEWTGCVTRGDARHCWTADEAHRQKARYEALLAKDLGIGYQVLHVVDSGGMFDPELWSTRCDRCRERYGDDHAQAVIDQLTLYYQALRAELPECIFEVVVQPYHFPWLAADFLENAMWYGRNMPGLHHLRQFERMEDPEGMVERLRVYHGRIAEGLPDDIIVTFREGDRQSFLALGEVWNGHPIDAWYYLYRTHGWRGLVEPQARLLKSWDRSEPRDVLFAHGMRPYHNFSLHEVQLPYNAEYAWNPDLPDAEPTFDISKRFYLEGARPMPEYQRDSLIPRIARRIWGRAAEPLIGLMRSNVSLPYMTDPGEVGGREGERFDDPNRFIEEQTEALVRARDQLNALMGGLDDGPTGLYGDIREEFGYRSLVWMQYFANLGAAKGEVESTIIRARRLAGEGQYDAAVEAVDAVRGRLPELARMVAAATERFRGVAVTPYIDAAVAAGGGQALARYDILAQDERLRALSEEIARQKETGAFPEHLRPLMTGREVPVAPMTGGFAADGHADEPAWANAREIEFFVTDRGRRLARWATRARLLWDDGALYVHAEMLEDEGVRAKNMAAGVWEIVRQDDWLELLIAPAAGEPVRSFLVQAGGMTRFQLGDREPLQRPEAVACRTVIEPGLWTAEMRIPFAALEMTPQAGAAWQINLVRHRAAKPESPGSEDSSIAADGFAPMMLVAEPAPSETVARVGITAARRADQTVEHGFATMLSLRPEIETNRDSRDVTISVAVRADGETVAEYTRNLRRLAGLWTPGGEIQMDLGRAFEGDLEVVVTALAGDGSLDIAGTFRVDERGRVNPGG